MTQPIDTAGIAARLAARMRPGAVLLVGITGAVAVGKSTLAAGLAAALAPDHRIDQFATDGFLRTNADLDAHGLTLRKGFPESYDSAALAATLAALRQGPADVPGYSHRSYDIDPALTRRVGPADIILVEGLGLAPNGDDQPARQLDVLIYLDANTADIERWFSDRFMALWHAAADDPASFYARFRGLSAADAALFAKSVWANINLPNLEEHIIHARAAADIVLHKAADHSLRLVTG
jgi:type I pantothenate kinase